MENKADVVEEQGEEKANAMDDNGEIAPSESGVGDTQTRSEEHTSELESLMRISYAVFCLKKKKIIKKNNNEKVYNKQALNIITQLQLNQRHTTQTLPTTTRSAM